LDTADDRSRLQAAAKGGWTVGLAGSDRAQEQRAVLSRGGEYWTLDYGGSVLRLRDSKGLRYLAALVSSPGVELHAVDLVSADAHGSLVAERGSSSVADPELEAAAGLGDAGEALDPGAKRAYQARVEELREEIEEAESFNDPERAASAREEMDFIASELASAVGLGGRDRKAASTAERARVNVTRAIKSTLKKVAEHDTDLGRQLEATVRTGTFCVYSPVPGFEIVVAGPGAADRAPDEAAPAVAEPEQRTGLPLPRLIGREAELALLEQAYLAARGGRGGSLHLIGGEPGVGKTRLAEAFCEGARAEGALVLWGHCWEGGGAPAFWPWAQVMRSYVQEDHAGEIVERMGPTGRYLAQLVPELGGDLGGAGGMLAEESDQARFAFFDAVATFLSEASRRRALVIVLDDLHAADEPSLLLLDFLAHQLSATGLFLIGSYRHGEGAVRESIGHLAVHANVIPLGGLAEDAVAGFVEQETGSSVPRELVDTLHGATEGNPFFMQEVVRLLLARGPLERPEALETGQLPVPEGVREAIRARLAPLPEETVRVLELAAVLGKEFSLPALERASDLPRERLIELLDEAELRGSVERKPGALGRYRFGHALIREVLYEGLTATGRMELHRQVGAGLEALYAADPLPHLAELAHHFLEAAPAGDPDKAIDYAAGAGDRAMALLAFEEAARRYRQALDALALKEPSDQSVRCNLLLALGGALGAAGDPEASRATFREAAELARRLEQPDKEAEAALGFAGRHWTVGATDEATVRMLERALAGLGAEDSPLRAELLGRLATALYYSPQRERSAPLGQEAVDIARRIGDEARLARALDARLAADWRPDNLDERLPRATEVVELAERVDDPETALRGRVFRVTCLLEGADAANADIEIEAAARLAEELRQPRFIWHTTLLKTLRVLMAGRLEEAEALAGRALEAGRHADERSAVQLYTAQFGMVRQMQGRVEDLEPLEPPIRRFVEEFPALPAWRCILALLYWELGREADARLQFELAAAREWTDLPHDSSWLPGLSRGAELCARLGNLDAAPRLYELLLPYKDRIVINGRVANHSLGPAARQLGMLAATMSGWDEGEAHFERAIELGLQMGERPLRANTQFDYASMLLARDAEGDRSRASELLERAAETAEELGMVALAEKAGSAARA
jgi:AAA ATPase-like protein